MRGFLCLGVALFLALGTMSPRQGAGKANAHQKDDLQALVRGNNDFAFNLYRRLSTAEGNVVFSPYSISNALAMTYAGAHGKTAEQMASVLHFTLGQDRLHAHFGKLIANLQKN